MGITYKQLISESKTSNRFGVTYIEKYVPVAQQ